jgi:hypothetical protein
MIRTRIASLALAAALGVGVLGAVPAASVAAKPHGVVLAPGHVKPGGKCHKGDAGCGKGGKFTGNFFG